MIVDLASPWCAAVEAIDSPLHRTTFRERHRTLFDRLCHQRAVEWSALLPTAEIVVRGAATRAGSDSLQQRIRTLVADAKAIGCETGPQIVLLPAHHDTPSVEVLPDDPSCIALFLPASGHDDAVLITLACAFASLTRWSRMDSPSPLAPTRRGVWDRWELARTVPLAEWVYTEGLGVYLAAALLPETTPADRIGTSPVAFTRLRERERALLPLLHADLDEAGLGLHLRWLIPGTAAGARTVAGEVIPAHAGLYLASRLVAGRVARIGVSAALMAES